MLDKKQLLDKVNFKGEKYYFDYFNPTEINIKKKNKLKKITPSTELIKFIRRYNIIKKIISIIERKIVERNIDDLYKEFPLDSFFYVKDLTEKNKLSKHKVSRIYENLFEDIDDKNSYVILTEKNEIYNIKVCISMKDFRMKKIKKIINI